VPFEKSIVYCLVAWRNGQQSIFQRFEGKPPVRLSNESFSYAESSRIANPQDILFECPVVKLTQGDSVSQVVGAVMGMPLHVGGIDSSGLAI
jgi:hypothetical protein